jgi:hypothetical protein
MGHIISMKAVFRDTTRFKSRGLYECILRKASWESVVKLTRMHFWRENIHVLNQQGCGFKNLDTSVMCMRF